MPLYPEEETISLDLETQMRLQCDICPYSSRRPSPNPTGKHDIVFVSQKGVYPIFFQDFKSQHIYDIECSKPNELPDQAVSNCCLGRAMSAITGMRPNVVVSIGYDVFKKLEQAFGHSPQGISHQTFMPTEYQGHKFWHISLDDFEVQTQLDRLDHQLRRHMDTVPEVLHGNPDSVEYIIKNEDIGPAFAWLRDQPYVGLDLETTGLRPYQKDTEILSAAIGTFKRTLCFPIEHPQTPSDFDWRRVMKEIQELPRHTKIIAHNSIFELEQLSYRYGMEYLYSGRWQDTMAQTYVLFTGQPKDLNSCIRREFGFNLKRISDIDVKNLRYIALDRVLEYNALDTKYTELLFHRQMEILRIEDLVKTYEMQIDRIPPVVIMQLKGMEPNDAWLLKEGKQAKTLADEALSRFASFPEVQSVVSKHGKCDPSSPADLKILFKDELGLKGIVRKSKDKNGRVRYNPKNMTEELVTESFDSEFTASCKHPVAKALDDFREHSKKYTTWVLPFSNKLLGGGSSLHDDGRIHPQHNSMKVITGRFSCTGPNIYAFPNRGGGKVWRNAFWAGTCNIMTAADLGQVEFRIVASVTQDAEMIRSIWEGYDVHMVWAQKLAAAFPKLVQDPSDPKQMKELRSLVKNKWTFPLVYRSLWSSVARDLGIADEQYKCDKLIKEFFSMFSGLAVWQEKMLKLEASQGYILTPFGRKYRGPLREQQTCNWMIQGSAFDYMCAAMCRMTETGIRENQPWLAPVNFVYDDLMHVIPEEHAVDASRQIIREITRTDLYSDWLTVPIEVEFAMGPSWGALKEVGKYSSDKVWS